MQYTCHCDLVVKVMQIVYYIPPIVTIRFSIQPANPFELQKYITPVKK